MKAEKDMFGHFVTNFVTNFAEIFVTNVKNSRFLTKIILVTKSDKSS